MAYTPTTWVNDSSPYINATNLNKIETGIQDAHTAVDRIINPIANGATGDGSTDDTAYLQAAVDAAAVIAGGEVGVAVVDLQGRQYAVSESIVMDSTHAGVAIQNGRLIARSDFSASTDPIIKIYSASTVIFGITLRNIDIDCATYAQGVLLDNTSSCTLDGLKVIHFDTYGIKTLTKGTELRMLNCTAGEFEWGETGFDLDSSRSGYAFWIETADFWMTNCVGRYSKYPFYKTLAGGGHIMGSHFYNPTSSGTAYNVYMEDPGQRSLEFIGCHFDNASFGMLDGYSCAVIGCSFYMNGTYTNLPAFLFTASTASEDAEGFIAIGNRFLAINGATYFNSDDHFLTLATTGSGSWASELQISWINGPTEDNVNPKYLLKIRDEIEITGNSVKMLTGDVTLTPDDFTFGDGSQAKTFAINSGASSNGYISHEQDSVVKWTQGVSTAGVFGLNWYSGGAYQSPVYSVDTANGTMLIGHPFGLKQYTVAGLPAAASYQWDTVIVTNANGGTGALAFSNGTNWIDPSTGTTVTT